MVRNDDGSPSQGVLPDEVAAARPFDGKAGGAERLLDGLERLRLHVFSIMSLVMSISMYLRSSIVSPHVEAPPSDGTTAQNPPSRPGRASATNDLP